MGATTTISHDLIAHVREIFYLSVESFAEKRRMRVGANGYSERALAAYIVAVAAIEAYVNEVFFSTHARYIKGAPLWQLRDDWVERLDLRDKIVLVAQLLFERPLSRGAQPLQRFDTLVRIRNDVVHYKMEFREPKFLAELQRQGIALPAVKPPPGIQPAEGPWAHAVSTTEGIRWANNVAVDVVSALVGLVPSTEDEYRERRLDRFGSFNQYAFIGDIARSLARNFVDLSEKDRDIALAALDEAPAALPRNQ